MDFAKIEKKWQKRWEDEKAFEVSEKSKKEKYYVLEQFPYPSGSGLHMGHAFIYSIGDIYARFKRMQNYNVLYPIGFDSFGLPAENAAIKAKSHPKKFTEDAIKNFISHFKRFGNSYDFSRMVETHKPDFYKWDQWIFLKMLEKGLAYRKKAAVNWCPKCNTVLANEQVQNGKCWRHEDTDVENKELEQWFLKITDYADQLYDNLDDIGWPKVITSMQKNWIGKKEWIDIDYGIEGTDEKVTVSTTRPDTNFGATFVVMAPEHPLLSTEKGLVPQEHRKAVDGYIASAQNKTDEERIAEGKKKTGVFTGLYCVNNLNGKKLPLWVSDFVLMSVGTGTVVGVPGHDMRDFEFAKEFDIPIVRVVVGPDGDTSKITKKEQVQEDAGTMVNSEFLDGMDIHKATQKIMDYLEEKGWGRRTFRYRLRDWLISRQRFWGTPIPIVYCNNCGAVPIPEKELPVVLPEDITFESERNPLVANEEFVNTKCPKCGGEAKRETDTMDTFVNSSWYYLRYADPKNDKKIFDSKKANYWCPIDIYIGGKEHACLHDIYFRFYHKFLRDIGLVEGDEPARDLFNQGFVFGSDGRKMSKSLGNVVLPDEAAEKYGVDATRMTLVSSASPEKDSVWSHTGAESTKRFLERCIKYVKGAKIAKSSEKQEHKINKAIKECTTYIAEFKYNLAVIKLRELFDSLETEIAKEDLMNAIKLLAPFCPHTAEELWEMLGNKDLISLATWPEADETKINESFDKAEQAVEKTVADILNILKIVKEKNDENPDTVYLYVTPNELENYNEKELSKRTNKMVKVFAVNDKEKYDPENKAAKAKFGKPAIFVE